MRTIQLEKEPKPLIKSSELLLGPSLIATESLYRLLLRLFSITGFVILFIIHIHSFQTDKLKHPHTKNFQKFSVRKEDRKYPFSYILNLLSICLLLEEICTIPELLFYLCKKNRLLRFNYIIIGSNILFYLLIILSIQKIKPALFLITLGLKFTTGVIIAIYIGCNFSHNEMIKTYVCDGTPINFIIDSVYFFLSLKVYRVVSSLYWANFPVLVLGFLFIILGSACFHSFRKIFLYDFYGKFSIIRI